VFIFAQDGAAIQGEVKSMLLEAEEADQGTKRAAASRSPYKVKGIV
jgi:hypothetical protein